MNDKTEIMAFNRKSLQAELKIIVLAEFYSALAAPDNQLNNFQISISEIWNHQFRLETLNHLQSNKITSYKDIKSLASET